MPPFKPLPFGTANSTSALIAAPRQAPSPNLFVDTVKEIPNKLKILAAGRGVQGLFSNQPAPDTFASAFKESANKMNAAVKDPKVAANMALNFTPMGMAKVVKPILGSVIKEAPSVFQGFKDLSTKVLEDLKGRSTVSKQYIQDATNRPELKDSERNVIRQVLDTMSDKTLNVQDFADRVKAELLPLKINVKKNAGTEHNVSYGDRQRYESYTLKENRGDVSKYSENVYESPIATSAGTSHFPENKNYFGHTRVEDMADNSTRRVIEVQSDLYQKGNVEKESSRAKGYNPAETFDETKIRQQLKSQGKTKQQIDEFIKEEKQNIDFHNTRDKEFSKLQQYNDPTAHFRMIREEIKKAAQDGKTKLQFPTGDTAMKIEGLGTQNNWKYRSKTNGLIDTTLTSEKLKVGMEVNSDVGSGNDWIITDVLGDGKFKAVSKNMITAQRAEMPGINENYRHKVTDQKVIDYIKENNPHYAESFDISGKVDTSNPIYKFYEKEVGKYLKKFDAKLVTDKQGVNWWEVPITKEHATQPVSAFGKIGLKTLAGGAGASAGVAALFTPSKPETFDRKEFEAKEYQIKDRPVKIIEKELPELGGVIFGEATTSIDDMRKIANVIINRANASNKTILQELTKKTKNGGFEMNAYAGKQYNKYRSNDFDFVSKQKAKSVDTVLEEIRSGKLVDGTNNDTYFSYSPEGVLGTFDNVIDNIKHAQGIR